MDKILNETAIIPNEKKNETTRDNFHESVSRAYQGIKTNKERNKCKEKLIFSAILFFLPFFS